MAKRGKYNPAILFPMFRKAAKFRNEMLDAGFTDNGGAIHSAERILDILCQRLKYPGLSHINNLKRHSVAEFSVAALRAHKAGEIVLIEHVAPLRALTRLAIDKVTKGASDRALAKFLRRNYRLVLLAPGEVLSLNKINRSSIDPNRIADISIRKARLSRPKRSTRTKSLRVR